VRHIALTTVAAICSGRLSTIRLMGPSLDVRCTADVASGSGGARSLGPTYEAALVRSGDVGEAARVSGVALQATDAPSAQVAVGPAQSASIADHAFVMAHDVDPVSGQR
jgi:hypothetical protein